MRITGRVLWRGGWLAVRLGLIALRFGWLNATTLGRPTQHQRARCLQWGCWQVRKVFFDRVEVAGPQPISGLLASNHLSYLDIALLGSLTPAIFVSKSEVRRWPLFGWFAAMGGTVFVRRERRGEVGTVGEQLRALLEAGHLVVLFPEGTSSGGESVLPFKSSLFEPIVGQRQDVHAGCIAYELPGGSAAESVCYWGDMSFGPHALQLLGKPKVRARVAFADILEPAGDRKALATQLWNATNRLHQELRAGPAGLCG